MARGGARSNGGTSVVGTSSKIYIIEIRDIDSNLGDLFTLLDRQRCGLPGRGDHKQESQCHNHPRKRP